MAPFSQDQIAQQMIAQLRVLDPSISAEVGTPERKIIDTVAQGIAEAQLDINLLSGALDLDAKFGSDLDTFVGLFGFGRQAGAFATGFVTFSRPTASPYNIVIPTGTQVAGNTTVNDSTTVVTYQTTTAITLLAGATQVIAPIQALLTGTQGNLAAGTITQFANLGAPPLGITAVNNEVPTSSGADQESDAELKVRFRNTVFRNLAGTADQYMALAVATQFTTKANVIGPVSRYKEYVQVPSTDDASLQSEFVLVTADATHNSNILTNVVSFGTVFTGNFIFGGVDSSGFAPPTTITSITGTTYQLSGPWLNSTASAQSFVVFTGQPQDGLGGGFPGWWTTTPSNNPYAQHIYTSIPYFASNNALGADTLFYRQDTDFVLNAPPLNVGDTYREIHEVPPDLAPVLQTPYNPNFTFFNVYTGSDTAVTQPRPNDVILVEYAYLSQDSRNDLSRGITNCVDVFINGENLTTTDAVIAPPNLATNVFNANAIDRFYYLNFRRMGQLDVPPVLGHIFQALFWQPVTALPTQIATVNAGITTTFLLNVHYWGVEDKTQLGGTVRSRNGIEWDAAAAGVASGDPDGGPYTGPTIGSTGASGMTVSGYTYDKNVVDLQVALDGSKQITTDPLAHRATRRYFLLDLTVVYATGAGQSATNTAIQSAVTTFFAGQYFGTTIQLSDLLLVVRNVAGVQNARWSNDVVNPLDDTGNFFTRVVEVNADGTNRLAKITATATNGSNVLTNVVIASGIPQTGQIVSQFPNSGLPSGTKLLSILGTTYVLNLAYTGTTGTGTFFIQAGFDTDFILRDSELPALPSGIPVGGTLPGLTIRARAQNTFNTS